MAKDTEKLIRQLSLISYLMAERRPVTALDIKPDVEGYSGMNEDAFARRFYADRAELESLRIPLTVEKPLDGIAEQEHYSQRPAATSARRTSPRSRPRSSATRPSPSSTSRWSAASSGRASWTPTTCCS